MNYRYRTGPPHRSVVRCHAGRVPRSRSAIAMAAIATVFILWVFGGAHCGLLRSGPAASTAPQPVLTSHAGPVAGTVDQPHLDHRPTSLCHKAFVAAVLPQSSSPTLPVLAVIVAVVAVAGWHTQPVAVAGRGPPRGLAAHFTGQDRLTRFCVSRR
ncbi:hypothetical protein AWC16_01265 [Mycolicibacter longobardus]|uniref:Lipoprotein LpqS n=1 Tax=Mycolicibacter longobardus TaxID=1108812 RepID=A0A1X1Y631_9MYCO|nr:hypothetical protein AWC16_01265 [Mycolicibacter longobardus]